MGVVRHATPALLVYPIDIFGVAAPIATVLVFQTNAWTPAPSVYRGSVTVLLQA